MLALSVVALVMIVAAIAISRVGVSDDTGTAIASCSTTIGKGVVDGVMTMTVGGRHVFAHPYESGTGEEESEWVKRR